MVPGTPVTGDRGDIQHSLTFLVLDLRLDILDSIRRLNLQLYGVKVGELSPSHVQRTWFLTHFKSNGFAREGLHENLHVGQVAREIVVEIRTTSQMAQFTFGSSCENTASNDT